jgi:phosphomevalonate kinase
MKVDMTAPGKVFLCGEYMAIEGAKATLLSVSRSAEISIEKIESSENRFITSALEKEFLFQLNNRSEIEWINESPGEYGLFLEIAIKVLGIKPFGVKFSINTDGFFESGIKLGIGSSAAISVAITKAINKYFKLKLDKQEQLYNSLEVHNYFQNHIGSGLDVLSSFYGFPVIECSKDRNSFVWNQVKIPKEVIIKFVKGQTYSDTREMIKKYHLGKLEHKSFFLEISKEMKEALTNLSQAYRDNNPDQIINSIKRYSTLMIEMDSTFNIGVYSETDKEISILADKEGLIYKPSGAGGGDLGIIIGDNNSIISKFMDRLSKLRMKQIELI